MKISAAIPANLRDELLERARANDRSMSAELRRALTLYLRPVATRELERPKVKQ